MPRHYFLSPTATTHLREHKRWSLEHFGHATTKRYFQDLDKGFQYIADNHERFQVRPELTRTTGVCIYPIRKHYIVFIPLKNGVHIADVLGQAQDIPNILSESAAAFQQELAQYSAKKGRKRD